MITVSASQLDGAFNPETGCLARWGFGYYDGLRAPSTPAMQLGSDAHQHVENYYRDGVHPSKKRGRAALLACVRLEVLPKREELPPDFLGPELPFKFRHENVFYNGVIDLPLKPDIHDHKFTSNLQYAKTTEQLLTDFQRILYAYVGLDLFKLDTITCKWGYTQTVPVRGDYPRHTSVCTEGRAGITEKFEALHELGTHLVTIRNKKTKPALPKNVNACYAYNKRCFHYDRCHTKTLLEIKEMGLLDKLREGRGIEAAPPKSEVTSPLPLPPKREAATESPAVNVVTPVRDPAPEVISVHEPEVPFEANPLRQQHVSEIIIEAIRNGRDVSEAESFIQLYSQYA